MRGLLEGDTKVSWHRNLRTPARCGAPAKCNTDIGGSASKTAEARERSHDALVGHVSFDERSPELVIFAVKNFGCLGESD